MSQSGINMLDEKEKDDRYTVVKKTNILTWTKTHMHSFLFQIYQASKDTYETYSKKYMNNLDEVTIGTKGKKLNLPHTKLTCYTCIWNWNCTKTNSKLF